MAFHLTATINQKRQLKAINGHRYSPSIGTCRDKTYTNYIPLIIDCQDLPN
jgi:hypothetical protein